MPKQVIKRFSINQIKETAQNRIREILEHVAGIPVELLDEKNHPCPACGGKDRFRLINADTGAVFCNQCFAKGNGDFIAAVQHYRRVDLPEALRLIADYLGIQAESPTSTNETTPKKPTGTWVYTDENGNPLYRVKRFDWIDNGKMRKQIYQEQYRNGKFEAGLSDELKSTGGVPLHLPELNRRIDDPVYIVEGEKCCDVLTELGLLATTASGGSNSKLDWSKHISNRYVIILPDEDRPGCEYALRVADSLHGVGCSIKFVSPPDLAEGEDVADWIERGGTKDELLRITIR